MVEVVFLYNNISTTIFSQENEKLKKICENFASQAKINKNSIFFSYNGYSGVLFNENLTFNQIANSIDKQERKMTILVNDIELMNENRKEIVVGSESIVCPICGKNMKINMDNYKITLLDCENGYKISDLFFDEYEKNQKINLSEIIYGLCKENNKGNVYNNEFHRCFECNFNLCPICKSIYTKNNKYHNIIDYDRIKYICRIHKEIFTSYCKKCKINLCTLCENNNKEHKINLLKEIIPNKKDLKENLAKIKRYIDQFGNIINKFNKILNNVKENLEQFYKIGKDLLNNYEIKNINYENLFNIKKIIKNNIIKDIKEINKENDIKNKFNGILDVYNKLNNKQKTNEIKLTLEILKEDINKEIYFLDNTDGDVKINLKIEEHHHDLLEELNESNVELFINDEKVKFQKYFVPEKEGIYLITLKLKNNIKDCKCMFYDCGNIIKIDLSSFNTNNVINMESMFKKCKNLKSLDLSFFDTKNVTSMYGMFYECEKLENIDLSFFDTKNVNNMKSMFSDCNNLTHLDLSSFDTQNVKYMNYMFYGCKKLINLDLSSFNTKNVIKMESMFNDCKKLININLSSFDTKNVETMRSMFYCCHNLMNIDLSSFKTPKLTNMENMFNECKNLTNIDLSSFDTKKVWIMKDMFNNCQELLSINLSSLDTRNVTNIKYMFNNCRKIKIIKIDKISYDKIKSEILNNNANIIFN